MFNNKDNDDFEKIFSKFYIPLYKYCYSKLYFDKQLAEETTNDIFKVLFEKWNKLNLNDHIKAYLYRVADNCIKYTLKKYRAYYTHIDSLDKLMENSNFIEDAYYDKYFQNDFTYERCIDIIKNSLPENYKKIFIYRFEKNKTINEISDLTGIPYSTLRLYLSKIKKLAEKEIKKIFR